jgi:hypothetical protein
MHELKIQKTQQKIEDIFEYELALFNLIFNFNDQRAVELINNPSMLKWIYRAKGNEVNRIIRHIQHYLGWSKTKYTGILYIEEGIDIRNCQKTTTIEHVVPVSVFRKLVILEKKSVLPYIFYPVALVSKDKAKKLPQKTGFDLEFPFKRYKGLINIKTYNDINVDPDTWTIKDHTNMVKNISHFKDLHKYMHDL